MLKQFEDNLHNLTTEMKGFNWFTLLASTLLFKTNYGVFKGLRR